MTVAVSGAGAAIGSPSAPALVGSAAKPAARLLPDAVLGMAVFLVTEVMLFCGLISAHIVLRGPAIIWPPMGQPRLPVAVTTVNTAFLILSGFIMVRAVSAYAKDEGLAKKLLGQTLALGVLFVSVQGYEWARLISFGLTSRSGLYGALFYTLVGAHGLHVIGAVSALAVVRANPTVDRHLAGHLRAGVPVVALLQACAACNARAPAPWLYSLATILMMVLPVGVFGLFMWWVRRANQ